MLNGRLSLHSIADVEAFTGPIVQTCRLELCQSDREELHAFLVEECWLLSLRFQPGGISFSTWAGNTLRLRVVDWQRGRFGRSRWQFHDGRVHERERPQFVPLDTELDGPLTEGPGDPALDSSPDLERLLGPRSSTRARDLEVLGLGKA